MALGAAGAARAVNYSSDREAANAPLKAIMTTGAKRSPSGRRIHRPQMSRVSKKWIPSSEGGRLVTMPRYSASGLRGDHRESFHPALQHQRSRAILIVQEAIKRFGRRRSIINLSSYRRLASGGGALLYASTKGAIETLTRDWHSTGAAARYASTPSLRVNTETEGNVAAGL